MGTVIINGKEYDSETGLAIGGESLRQIVNETVEKSAEKVEISHDFAQISAEKSEKSNLNFANSENSDNSNNSNSNSDFAKKFDNSAKKSRKMSRQEKLAAEIAQEFSGNSSNHNNKDEKKAEISANSRDEIETDENSLNEILAEKTSEKIENVEKNVKKSANFGSNFAQNLDNSPNWLKDFADAHENAKKVAEKSEKSLEKSLENSANLTKKFEFSPAEEKSFAEKSRKNSFASAQNLDKSDKSPSWISNFVEGGAPVEIEPIGLEKAARDAEKIAEKSRKSSENFANLAREKTAKISNFYEKSFADLARENAEKREKTAQKSENSFANLMEKPAENSLAEKHEKANFDSARKNSSEKISANFETAENFAPSIHRQVQHSKTLNRHFVKSPLKNFVRENRENAENLLEKSLENSAKNLGENSARISVKTAKNSFEKSAANLTNSTKNIEKDEPFRAILTRAQERNLAENRSNFARKAPNLAEKSALDNIFDNNSEKLANRAENRRRNQIQISNQIQNNNNRDNSALKNALIREQMDAPIDKNLSRKARKMAEKSARKSNRKFSFATIMTAMCAIFLIGGFITYTQMPNISVRVAAVRAGVNAKNPYAPSGYSIDGPVAYAPGSVTINYKSNGGAAGYSLTQSNSGWDSDAVRDNLVKPNVKSGDENYQVLNDNDLTIYYYNGRAAWVDGGVLYTINGENLGESQILRIANSV